MASGAVVLRAGKETQDSIVCKGMFIIESKTGSLKKEITPGFLFYDLGQKQQDFILSTFSSTSHCNETLLWFVLYLLFVSHEILPNATESLAYNSLNIYNIFITFIK